MSNAGSRIFHWVSRQRPNVTLSLNLTVLTSAHMVSNVNMHTTAKTCHLCWFKIIGRNITRVEINTDGTNIGKKTDKILWLLRIWFKLNQWLTKNARKPALKTWYNTYLHGNTIFNVLSLTFHTYDTVSQRLVYLRWWKTCTQIRRKAW